MDLETSYHLFPLLLPDREKWSEVQDANSEGHAMLQKFLDRLEYFPESLRTFRGQTGGLLELYLEPLALRSADAYAAAYARYFAVMQAAGGLFNAGPFEQSFPMESKFVPISAKAVLSCSIGCTIAATPVQKEYAKVYNRCFFFDDGDANVVRNSYNLWTVPLDDCFQTHQLRKTVDTLVVVTGLVPGVQLICQPPVSI